MLGLPRGQQRLSYLSNQLMFTRVYISKKLEWKLELGLKHRYSMWVSWAAA